MPPGDRVTDNAAPRNHGSDVRLSVVIPMYQESARIGPTVRDVSRTIRDPAASGLDGVRFVSVHLVDDGSGDGTARAARRAIERSGGGSVDGSVFDVVSHGTNRGKGAAVRTGLAAALNGSREPPHWILMMDADNAARLGEVGKLLGARGASGSGPVDLVLGSRRVPDAEVDAALGRRLAGLLYVGLLRSLGLRLARDPQCGFKLYSARAARVMLRYATEDRFAFDIEHVLLCHRAGLRTAEVGIAWRHVEGGTVRPLRDGVSMLRAARRIARRHRETRVSLAAPPAPPAASAASVGGEAGVRGA